MRLEQPKGDCNGPLGERDQPSILLDVSGYLWWNARVTFGTLRGLTVRVLSALYEDEGQRGIMLRCSSYLGCARRSVPQEAPG